MAMPREKSWTGLKITAIFGVSLFAIVLAYVIGSRLSSEAIAVLAGSVCGVSAAIPTSLIILAVTRRNGQKKENNTVTIPQSQPAMPQVVVVPPMQFQQPQGLAPPSTWRNSQPREFNVVGDEEWQ